LDFKIEGKNDKNGSGSVEEIEVDIHRCIHASMPHSKFKSTKKPTQENIHCLSFGPFCFLADDSEHILLRQCCNVCTKGVFGSE